METGGSPPPEGATAVLDHFEAAPLGEPYTAAEVAVAVGLSPTRVTEALEALVADGPLRTKTLAGDTQVWWYPASPALVASERQFRAVFEEAFDAMLVADDEGRYVEVNPAACELFGLAESDLLGRRAEEFAADGYDIEAAWADFRDSDLDRGLFPLVRPDGQRRILEFAATPNILPGRHLSVLRDVTERRATKAELARERERAQRYQRTLAADAVVELEVRLETDGLCQALSAGLDADCEFEGMVPAGDGRFLHYLSVEGADAAAIRAITDASPDVVHSRVVAADEDATLVEADLARSPARALVEAGASPRSMHGEHGEVTVVAEVGADADLQALVNEFQTAYPDARVLTKRTLDRPVVTTRQYRESLVAALTERQTETLRMAWLAGYFEWPRTSQAEELADAMGIASPTWLRHLRHAESKLVAWFFEELEV